jgi:acyl-CoA synthetase (AMP-forming)/AMP-acid ligase II
LRFTQAGGKLDDAAIRELHELISARKGELWIMYGQTEATARIAILDANLLGGKLGSVGKALPGGAIRIVDESRQTLPARAQGQIEYTGPNVMMGYAMGRADLEREDELHGCLRTGDRGYVDEDGFLYVLGRTTRETKLYGLRVNLDDIEAMVRAHGPAAAIGTDERVVVFCEFGEPRELDEARTSLATRLGVSRHGFDFRRVAQLPTLPSGKIDYPTLAGLV